MSFLLIFKKRDLKRELSVKGIITNVGDAKTRHQRDFVSLSRDEFQETSNDEKTNKENIRDS